MSEKTTQRPSGDRVTRVTSIDDPQSGNNLFFGLALGLILVAGIAAVVFVALNRETNLGVAPEANVDHWHSAFVINNCGVDLPATTSFESPDGLHTHGDGLLHLHPYNPTASGRNATLGSYVEASGAELTDDGYISGFSDPVPVEMTEAAGCDGEPATLQLAVWDNAFDETAEPTIITEGIADFRFESPGQAITLALVPEGGEPGRPPADRISLLLDTGPGGPIAGVEEGEDPIVTTSTSAPEAEADDTESSDEAEDTESSGDAEDTESSDEAEDTESSDEAEDTESSDEGEEADE